MKGAGDQTALGYVPRKRRLGSTSETRLIRDAKPTPALAPQPTSDGPVSSGVKRRARRSAAHDPLPALPTKILLVEEHVPDAELLSNYLRAADGPCPRRVEGLGEAISVMGQENFQVIIADLSLPDAEGLDIVHGLRSAAPEAALILLSSSNHESLALQALKLGTQDYLVKDELDSRTLIRSLRHAWERKLSEQRLLQLAHCDPLTGLANRLALRDRLSTAVAKAQRSGVSFAVMWLDLDRFKAVNDRLGHDVGDRLLRDISLRIKESVRCYDTVARLGGDEFAVLLDDIESEEEVTEVGSRILAALARPSRLDDHELTVTTSIGAVLFSDTSDSEDALLRAADSAMYAAKRRGGGTMQVYRDEHRERDRAHLEMLSALNLAHTRGEFVVHFQAQCDLRTQTVIGYETLLRWKRAKELLPASEFISILEDSGAIVSVGRWIIEQACSFLRCGRTPQRVAVNLSRQEFQTPDLVPWTLECLRRHDLPNDALELEINEQLLTCEMEQTQSTLRQFKGLGVRLSIDDFGTGRSSLAELLRLGVDTLKIDKSFVALLPTDSVSESVVHATIDLAHRLGVSVIAEGVETHAQLAFLQAAGCDAAQGFLFGPPAEPLSHA